MKRRKPLLFLVGILITVQSFSYPISPRPLRKLIIESQYIFIGYVYSVNSPIHNGSEGRIVNEDFDPSEGVRASIAIKEVLQGALKKDTIHIGFNPFMICPAPAHYEEGTWVMAFVNETEGRYSTHALSYGVKQLDSVGLNVYRARVKEMQSILPLKDSTELFTQTVEWLVRCAERRPTEWEGMYELSPEADFMSSYERSNTVPYKYGLTEEHLTRLKDAVISAEAYSYTTFGLVDMVIDKYRAEILPVLLHQLENISEANLWYADDYMRRLKPKDSKVAEKLIGEYTDLQYDYSRSNAKDRPEKLKAIIKEFLALPGVGK